MQESHLVQEPHHVKESHLVHDQPLIAMSEPFGEGQFSLVIVIVLVPIPVSFPLSMPMSLLAYRLSPHRIPITRTA